MALVIPDLDYMILERVQGEFLREVARVNKTWRKRIAANIRRMRQIRCEKLLLTFGLSNVRKSFKELNIEVNDGQLYRKRPGWDRGKEKRTVEYESIGDINKYLPTDQLELILLGKPGQCKNLLDSIPDWWIKQIGKICCRINNPVFGNLISRLRHISLMQLQGDANWQIEEYMNIIQHTQQVDKFWFSVRFTSHPPDSINVLLSAIVNKSYSYPTEFPRFFIPIPYTDFIRALELMKFPEAECHTIMIRTSESSKRDEWFDWVKRNTKPLKSKQCPIVHQCNNSPLPFANGNIWSFNYRKMLFRVRLTP